MGILADMTDFFASLTPNKQCSLKKGQSLFRQGDVVEYLYSISTGCIRLQRLTLDGSESIMYEGISGSFAEASLFSSHYHCEAIAVEDSNLTAYTKDIVIQHLTNNPLQSLEFMTTLAKQVQQLRTHLNLRNIKSARERIYRYFVISAKTVDNLNFVKVTTSLKDLAKQLGLAHETFYRELAKLEKDDLVERHANGDIIVRKITD